MAFFSAGKKVKGPTAVVKFETYAALKAKDMRGNQRKDTDVSVLHVRVVVTKPLIGPSAGRGGSDFASVVGLGRWLQSSAATTTCRWWCSTVMACSGTVRRGRRGGLLDKGERGAWVPTAWYGADS